MLLNAICGPLRFKIFNIVSIILKPVKYKKIKLRGSVSKDFDSMRVYKAIGRYNTREPLPEDFASTMTPSENEWIENGGGEQPSVMWPESKLKEALRIS
jgi:hypothetical protein